MRRREENVTDSRITRFCACCGRPVTLVRIASKVSGRTRFFSDDTGQFYNGRLFLCSEECCASIVKGFGSVDAFQEWVCAPLCASSAGAHPGEE
jgi:hypothetical protein